MIMMLKLEKSKGRLKANASLVTITYAQGWNRKNKNAI